jgi:succinate dehydrogenase/fumarate reductase flavoprotein subunit
MSSGLGPVRSGKDIEAALQELYDVRSSLDSMTVSSKEKSYNREAAEALELPLMLQTALLVATAALRRTESRGSHYRTDYPEKNDDEWLKNVVLSRGEDGGIRVSVVPVLSEV